MRGKTQRREREKNKGRREERKGNKERRKTKGERGERKGNKEREKQRRKGRKEVE